MTYRYPETPEEWELYSRMQSREEWNRYVLRNEVSSLRTRELAHQLQSMLESRFYQAGLELDRRLSEVTAVLDDVLDLLASDGVPPDVRKQAVAALRRIQELKKP